MSRLSTIFPVLFMLLAAMSMAVAAVRIEQRIDVVPAWAGHPVRFAIITHGGRQYVASYDAGRNMTVASRNLGSDGWTTKILPSKIGWDSHNYITLAIDRGGCLHVVGNLHNSPLVYFRTVVPGDIGSLHSVGRMTGRREQRMTYPGFLANADGSLVFHYRDGQSGDGAIIYNRYDEGSREWTRLVDRPLFDGQGRMNAYAIAPARGPDGCWHMTWVWRDTPDAETCHDLSYARSPDLVHWETASGRPVPLPITIATPGVLVDDVPVGGGILNGTGKIGFDEEGRPVIAYHKFSDDSSDAPTQVYLARFDLKAGAWGRTSITDWTFRWEPRGRGTIPVDVSHSALQRDAALGLYINLGNKRHGHGTWLVDAATLRLTRRIRPEELARHVPGELYRAAVPGMSVHVIDGPDDGVGSPPGTRYLLRWETLPSNRDQAREGALPEPAMLQVIVTRNDALPH